MRRDGEAFLRQKVKEKKGEREGEQASKRAAGVLGRVHFSVCGSKPTHLLNLGSSLLAGHSSQGTQISLDAGRHSSKNLIPLTSGGVKHVLEVKQRFKFLPEPAAACQGC